MVAKVRDLPEPDPIKSGTGTVNLPVQQPPDKTTTMTLQCKLTDPEKLSYSKEMSEAISKKARAEDQLKAFKAQISAEIAGQDGIINKLAERINNGWEFRPVECVIKMDYKTRKKSFYRKDTGEFVDTRDMTESDLQAEMPIS